MRWDAMSTVWLVSAYLKGDQMSDVCTSSSEFLRELKHFGQLGFQGTQREQLLLCCLNAA